jgi:hypothetical protein
VPGKQASARFDLMRMVYVNGSEISKPLNITGGLKTKMETKESFVTFLTNEGISDIEDLMVHIQVFIDSPELIYELPATERETLEARMDEALSVL